LDFLTDWGVIIALVCAGAAVIYGVLTSRWLLALSPGNEEMQAISRAVQEGATAYLRRQYTIIAGVAVVLAIVLGIALEAQDREGILTAIGFLIGGTFSGAAGFIGMNVSVRANARVAESARSGVSRALDVAFKGGAVTGLLVAGLALLGVAGYYGILILAGTEERDAIDALVGLGFGGSLISVFARLGGGIFTKAADVGADLVGKVEAGIPEDDPRNPATIADNVGDNVGDCAGMAADLFESYEVTLVASLILGAAAYTGSEIGAIAGVMFPLFVRAVGVITSIIGIMSVSPRSEDEHGMKAINRGFFISAVISAAAVFVISNMYMHSWKPGFAVAFGLILASVIQVLTQHFTDTKHRPVQEIAESTVTGPATTVLSGFSVGLESTVWSIIVICGNETEDDIAYLDVLRAAREKIGVRTFHAVARGARKGQYPGYIDGHLIERAIPDYLERTFYISGPQAMVKGLRHMLVGLGVRRSQIKVDFFPGFA